MNQYPQSTTSPKKHCNDCASNDKSSQAQSIPLKLLLSFMDGSDFLAAKRYKPFDTQLNVKTLKQSLRSVLIVTVLILILATILGSPAGGIYVAIILIIPLTLVSIISMVLMNVIFDKLKIVKKYDRYFLGISLPVLGSLVYLASCALMFGDVIAALKESWFLMITITVMITMNVIMSTEKVDEKDN